MILNHLYLKEIKIKIINKTYLKFKFFLKSKLINVRAKNMSEFINTSKVKF